MTQPLPKVVVVGFNKCATRSIAELFRDAGHRTIHQKHRRLVLPPLRLGKIMQENLKAGRPVFAGLERFQVYCDLLYSTKEADFDGNSAFREIIRDYPDAILILNYRNEDDWIRSRLQHGHGTFARKQMAARGIEDQDALVAEWQKEFRQHMADLRAFMADRPGQLVEFNIDEEDGTALANALPQYGLRPETWGDIGRSRGRRMGPIARGLKKLNAERKLLR